VASRFAGPPVLGDLRSFGNFGYEGLARNGQNLLDTAFADGYTFMTLAECEDREE